MKTKLRTMGKTVEKSDEPIEFWLERDADDGEIYLKGRVPNNDDGWYIISIKPETGRMKMNSSIGEEMAAAGMELNSNGEIVIE